MKENRRKCSKCGASPSENPAIILHRFPKPGTTNSLRCELWARYCFPHDSWHSVEFQTKLYSEHRMLCTKHFKATYFVDTAGKRLFKAAVPDRECDKIIMNPVGVLDVQHTSNTNKIVADGAGGTKAADCASVEKCLDVQDLGPYSPDIHGVIDDDTHKETEDQLFSWQRTSEINCEDFDDNPDNSTIEEEISESNGVVFKTEDDYEINGLDKTRTETDERVSNRDEDYDLHEGYKCDMCKGPIRRFRYSCVECANYDLCGACEARAGHPQHYLLRIPRPRPHVEIQLIMDTIRRFLTADLKSLRTEANFVSTLIDEMKSEVVSEAGSDPVPDEPDYPIQSDVSSNELEDCEMEVNNASHASETHDDTQEFTYLDEDILEERDIPKETKDKNVINIASDRDRDSQSRLQNVNINHKPERRIIRQTGSLSPSNALDKVNKRLVVPQNYSRSPSNALGKVSKSILGTLPKTVSINKDVFKLLKATNDADTMRNTVNTIKHSLQSQVSIKVQRLSKKEIKTATNT